MTPIRSIGSNKLSDLFTNQTSNGVYPVSTSPFTLLNQWTAGNAGCFHVNLSMLLKAEV